ncbi:hypothetical protein E2C01_048083 [Portunus trituberculatus]|uniref:Uncharacterized protein n=1 Tax=Portunus trituberculatus TaxID=210409 RepID=A0A5B7G9R7_PORTR|nr:hypothetical protein [Portunus trituberculatus]
MIAKERRDSMARPPTNLYGKRIRVITIWTLHLLQQVCDQRGLLKIYTHNGWMGWTRGLKVKASARGSKTNAVSQTKTRHHQEAL